MNDNIKHCYSEVNQALDTMAKYTATCDVALHFEFFQDLVNDARGPYQLDKCQLPNLRIKYDKTIFWLVN